MNTPPSSHSFPRVRTSGSVLVALGVALGACSNDDSTPAPTPVTGQQWTLETGTFTVEPGTERQSCYFYEVPSDEPTFVNRIAASHAIGSHHMNIFRVKTIVNLDGAPGDVVEEGECWQSGNWADWPLVINNQSDKSVTDWTLPEGVAHRFEPREKLMIQTHYVNATTQSTPGVGKVVVTFYQTPPEAVKAELGTLFATNQNIKVCPGEVNKTFDTSCRFAKDQPVTIIGANGHFHSRGQKFTMSLFDPIEGKGNEFYSSKSWNDPPFVRDLNIAVPPGGGISYACTYAAKGSDCGDPVNGCCYTFGPLVETSEHCNAFVYYYPRQAQDRICF